MNDRDFKRHLKDLAHGHHHPEEHDWMEGAARKAAARRPAAARKTRKSPKK